MIRNKQLIFVLFFFTISCTAQKLSIDPNNIDESLLKNEAQYADIALQIWDLAELGYQEYKSSNLLKGLLEKEGFRINSGVAEIPTAFTAEFGSGKPVIAIMGEFDALPGVSQSANPFKERREEINAGHACGHHLFGTGSAAASIAIKNYLQKTGTKGTIRFYGTPAEEGGAGKVYMVRAGLFEDVDAVLHWHPSSGNSAPAASSLANKSAKFRFYGTASHAAGAPQNGRSALDGVEAMNYMINLMREHIPQESRIHYVITSGGEAPNVVPEFAEVFYYVRHPQAAQVQKNFAWVVEAAEGAAKGTQTKMEYEVIHGLYNLLPNENLSRVMHGNLVKVGGVHYDEKETIFAKEIATTLVNPDVDLETAKRVAPFAVYETGKGGSTDVGDVSWVVPTAGLRTATWVPGTSAHSWQAVAAGGTSIGIKGMMNAAKTMAMTAIELYHSPEVIEKAWQELEKRRGPGYEYEPILGDRPPPLDYRKLRE